MRKCIPFLLASTLLLTSLSVIPADTETVITAHAQESSLSNPNASSEAQSLYRFLHDG